MSSGDRHGGHPIRADEARELATAMADPRVHAAIAAYTKVDETRDIPDLGGSDNAGQTVFFDHGFVQAILAGKFKYDGRPLDPRPYLRIHEAVEGALIRILGFDYTRAHLLATIAERHAVEAAGMVWDKYQEAFRPFVRATEAEPAGDNFPPDLLLEAYKGTKLYAILAAAQNRGPGQIVLPGAGESRGSYPDMGESAQAHASAPGSNSRETDMGYGKEGGAGDKDAAKDAMHQRMAIGGAHHLHEAGHITAEERDQFQAAARAKLGQAKPAEAPAKPAMASGKVAPAPAKPSGPPARPFGMLA